MGANRAQRRRQEREQIREWKHKNQYERMMSFRKNGITENDLSDEYEKGYREGYMYSAELLLKKMYAAIATELLDSGNPKEDVIQFVVGVDHRFSLMFDADDEIDAVYDKIGVRFNVDRNAINRVEEI